MNMIEINLGFNPCENKVIIDGVDISNKLLGIKIEKTGSTIPVLELQLADEIKVTGNNMMIIRDKGLDEYTQEELLYEVAKRSIKKVGK
jgi:hypothetical protein